MRGFLRRLAILFRRRQFDRELEEEMHAHLEMKAEQQGPTPPGASSPRLSGRSNGGLAI